MNKNKIFFSTKHAPTWFRALIMAAFTLTLITLGAEATTISKTNDVDASVDDGTIDRSVTFTTDDFVTGSRVSDVNITVNFAKVDGTCAAPGTDWPFNQEISAYLTSPEGTQVVLIKDNTVLFNSTYTDNEMQGGNVTVLFDDSASTPVGGPAPVSGSFRPVEPLSAFIGEDPVGIWTLTMGDNHVADPLCFYESTLTINADQPPIVDDGQIFSVPEDSTNGDSVGTVAATDPDMGDKLTYAITGGDPGGVFAINPSTGEITVADGSQLDYETTTSYTLTVRVTDSSGLWDTTTITINVTNVNDAPTDISLDNNSVLEHKPAGTLVGNFSSTDQDTGDTHTYSLVESATYPDNDSFTISSGQLKTAEEFDFDVKQTYTIKVETDDGHGGTFSKEFTINIIDGNDPPTDIDLDNDTVAENQPSGTAVGTFTTIDPNDNGPYTYELVSGSGSDDNASFTIGGAGSDQLQTAATFDQETKSSYSIRVRSTDDGDLWFEEVFIITVTDVNDAPTNITLDNSSVAENQSPGALVGTFSTTDQDSGDTHTYVLTDTVNYPDNASFTIGGVNSDQLQTAAVFDYETKSSYSIRVQTDDGNGGKFVKTLTITITNVNEDPTNITLSNSSVAENQSIGTLVGNLNTTDPDSGDSFTYQLAGSYPDNSAFRISGNHLQTNVRFDYEVKDTYTINIETRDSGGLTFEKEFTITIADANDPPVAVDDSETTDEDTVLNVAAPGVLANDTDEDNDTLTVMSADAASTQGAIVNVATDGGFTYDPTAVAALQALNVGENIEDTFSYTVRDGGIIFDTATVTVTVTGVNDAPVAHNDNVTTVLETAVLVSPLTNDTDPDTTDTKSLASFGQGAHGTVTDNHDGTLTYTPDAGYIGSDSFNYTVEDSHGASDGGTVNVTINPQMYYVYLPVALNNYTTAPDLVVTSLQASSDAVEVVIENQGSQATASGFWVDFYVNPTPPPAAANELWPDLSDEGIAWGVTTSLAPGQALTLTYSVGGPNLYYSAEYSDFSGVLPVGTPIYAQVDSARVGSPDGAIEETHEILGEPYNNILQALATAALTHYPR